MFFYKIELSYLIKYINILLLICLLDILFIFYFSLFSIKINFDFEFLLREYQDLSSKI